MSAGWRRLGPAELPPAEAVARPVGLLEAIRPGDPPIASWSTTSSPGLVVGRSPNEPSIDAAAAATAGVSVVRRASGGGPVLWDRGLLSLDVILPRGHALAPADVVDAYRWLGEAFASALRSCGVADVEVVSVQRARQGRGRRGAAAGACYGGLSPFEVTVAGRKVVGLSQARRRPGTLLQAGLLMDLDAGLMAGLLASGADFRDDLRHVAAGLHEFDPAIAEDEVIAAVDAAVDAALERAS